MIVSRGSMAVSIMTIAVQFGNTSILPERLGMAPNADEGHQAQLHRAEEASPPSTTPV